MAYTKAIPETIIAIIGINTAIISIVLFCWLQPYDAAKQGLVTLLYKFLILFTK
jgi:hypothetical protein